MSSTWETLSKIDVSEHTEEKNGLTYLSWAWAWGKVKDNYPKARYVKRIWDTELPYTKDDQGYAYVEVTVIIGDEEQSELMPVLDYKNQSVKNPNSFQVNTALQRCLAKCCAMHGLGHYIYAGEDLPQGMEEPEPEVSIHPAEGDAKEAKGYKLISEVFTTFIPECEDVSHFFFPTFDTKEKCKMIVPAQHSCACNHLLNLSLFIGDLWLVLIVQLDHCHHVT